MLKKVKVVFDAEAKALALRLFGCWADMILLSLQSSDILEV